MLSCDLESMMAFGRNVLFFSHIFGIFSINIVEKTFYGLIIFIVATTVQIIMDTTVTGSLSYDDHHYTLLLGSKSQFRHKVFRFVLLVDS